MTIETPISASAQHTPGPWEYDGEYVDALEGDEPISICTLAEIDASDEGGWQRKANARLIAAAPDLLAALEEMQMAGAEMHDHFGSLMDGLKQPGSSWNAADMRQRQMQRALKSGAAAIAKATGG